MILNPKRTLLFLGAGFSLGATSISGRPMPIGAGLSKLLVETLGESFGDEPLADTTDYFLRHESGGADRLVQLLNEQFRVQDVLPWQQDLVLLPWKRIYTTNYDDIVEHCHYAKNRKIRSFTPEDAMQAFQDRVTSCIHLNGFVERVKPETIEKTVRLGTLSYANGGFEKSEWSRVFRHDCEAAESIVFLGYAIRDLPLQNIVVAERLKEKSTFVVGPSVSNVQKARIQEFGQIVESSCEDFFRTLPTLKDIEENESKNPIGLPLQSFGVWESDFRSSPATDSDRWKLFLTGRIAIPTLRTCLSETDLTNRRYVVKRDSMERCVQSLLSGNDSILLSRVANGKTVCALAVAAELASRGYRVIEFKRESARCFAEVDQLLQPGTQKTLLLIDDAYRVIDVVRRIAQIRSDSTVLLLTGKSQGIAYYRDDLISALGSKAATLAEFNLDFLSETEIDDFLDMFQALALLGDYTNELRERLKIRVRSKFSSQLQTILLEIVGSENVRNKISSSLGLNVNDEATQRYVAAALVSFVCAPQPQDVAEVSGIKTVNAISREARDNLNEIFETRNGAFQMTSAVLGRFVLCNVIRPDVALETLKAAATYAYSRREGFYGLADAWILLMRFSIVQHILPETDRKRWLLEYYEWLGAQPASENNADFWLQYGVARLFAKHIDEAEICLKNAEKIALRQKRHDILERIHNHTARFLIESVEDELNAEVAYDVFRDANTIVERQMNSDRNLHYPYRIALNYAVFHDVFFERLPENKKIQFLQICDRIYQKTLSAPKEILGHPSVAQCRRDFGKLLLSHEGLSEQAGFSASIVQIKQLKKTSAHYSKRPA
jgi:hypothetical protein